MAALAERSPVRLVPEQPLVAAVWQHVVDHGRRHEPPCRRARHAQGVTRQEGGASSSPARPVAPARRARALPVQRALDLHRAPEPRRTMHGRLARHGNSHKAKPAAAMPGGLLRHFLSLVGPYILCSTLSIPSSGRGEDLWTYCRRHCQGGVNSPRHIPAPAASAAVCSGA
jgi:hypothetical protein